MDSEGRVRLAPATRVAARPRGAVRLGARPRRARAGSTPAPATTARSSASRTARRTLLFDAAELEVHALAVGPGRPALRGHVARRQGLRGRRARARRRPSSIPRDKYIWALAFDDQGRLLVATGAEGTVHRVDRAGQGARSSSTEPRGATSPRWPSTARGNVYAGSSPGGVLYRIDRAGKVFVLHDSAVPRGEGAGGGRGRQPLRRRHRRHATRTTPAGAPACSRRPPAAPRSGGRGHGHRELQPSAAPPSPAARAVAAPARVRARGGAAKGAVLRVLPSGEVDTLWSSTDEMPHALAAEPGRRARGHRQQGQALPRPRRPHLDDARVLPRRAGHEPAARPRRRGVPRHVEPGRVHALERGAGARGHASSPR